MDAGTQLHPDIDGQDRPGREDHRQQGVPARGDLQGAFALSEGRAGEEEAPGVSVTFCTLRSTCVSV